MRGGGRVTNLALLSLLAVAFASGWVAFELGGQPARATLVIHAAAGVAIVLLAPWKALVARRGLRRPRRLRWPSLVLALGVVISLGFGFVHSFGRPDIGYLTAIDFHVGAAICILPFVIWHVLARPAKLRRADLSRRNFLKGGALLGVSIIGVAALPAARRAPTGSYKTAYAVPTQWMFDSTPAVDTGAWRLAVGSRRWSYDDLIQFDDRVTAVLDCTGGWYSEQEWGGVWLNRLLPPGENGVSSVYVKSVTGYGRRFDIGDAPGLLVATRLDGGTLEPGHGFPLRLVAPGRRGFAWVKWVASIETDAAPG